MSVQFDNLGDVKPKVTAGGKDKAKFVPNLNVSFHDDEFYFNLNRKDKIIKNEKAATASGKTSLGGIDTDMWYIDDKGRLKWDIEFASRPKINSWTWELKHTKGIEFYYQGELTTEEIADGCVRPDEVVGSYAVYCNKAHNKYKTGKLCHIYRPFCYDAKGKTIYADLNIADGQLTITIDAAWLDSAAYPVRLDPTIGYTSAGATSSVVNNYIQSEASNVTMPENGNASKVYAYMRGNDHTAYVGYYNDNAGVPNSLIDGNKSVTVNSSTPAWYNASVTGSLTSGEKYYPTVMTNPNGGSYNHLYHDTSTGTKSYYRSLGSSGTSMPSSYGTAASSTNIRSIYMEYTLTSTGNNYYYQQQLM